MPFLAIGVVATLCFHPATSTPAAASCRSGVHGVFAALPRAWCSPCRASSRPCSWPARRENPSKDLSRAILTAMAHRRSLYTLPPGRHDRRARPGRHRPELEPAAGQDPSDYGAWYTLALAVGAGWLAKVLIIDAVDLPRWHGHRLRGHDGASLLRARRGTRDAERPRQRRTPRACRSCRSSSASVVGALGSARSRAGLRWSASSPVPPRSCMRSRRSRSRRCTGWTATGHVPTGCRCRVSCSRPASVSANLIIYWGGYDTRGSSPGHAPRARPVRHRQQASRHRHERTMRQRLLGRPMARGPRAPRRRWPLRAGARASCPDWVDLPWWSVRLAIFYWAVSLTLTKDEGPGGGSKGRAADRLRGRVSRRDLEGHSELDGTDLLASTACRRLSAYMAASAVPSRSVSSMPTPVAANPMLMLTCNPLAMVPQSVSSDRSR